VPYDLTVSNPTRSGISYPEDLLAPLAAPRGLIYEPDPRGPIVARQAVARSYRALGAQVDPDSVILTASTSEAYSLLFKLLCDPGDTVLVPSPSYPLLDQLCRFDGVRSLAIPLHADDEWRPDLARLADAPANTKAIILVHPNNPTGSHVHPEDAAAVGAACRERGWALIADEVFLPYPLDGGPGSRSSLAGSRDNLTVCLGGVSKALGLPQLKLGWMVVSGPERLCEQALSRLDHIADAALSVGTPVALAAPRLLESAASIQRAISDRCRANLATLRDIVRSVPAVTVPAVGGGWSALLRLPAVLDDEDFALELLTRRGVAVQPGYLFDFPMEGVLVLSLLTPEAIWRHGIDAIIDLVRSRL
jgi:aspartate/methionine/tyrosine aminotransferase